MMATAAARIWRLVVRVGRIAAARASVRPMLYRNLRGYPVDELRKTELRCLSGAVLSLPGRDDPILVRRVLLRHNRLRVFRNLPLQWRVRKVCRLKNQYEV